MSCLAKRFCLICYSENYASMKDNIANVFSSFGFVTKHFGMKMKTKKAILRQFKQLESNLPSALRCVIVFYLSDQLTQSDLDIISIFHKIKKRPKLFIFYNDKQREVADQSLAVRFDVRDLLYIYCQKGSSAGSFNFVERLCNEIKDNEHMPITDIYQKLLSQCSQNKDCLDNLYLFCSLTSPLKLNKKGIMEYLCVPPTSSDRPLTENDNEYAMVNLAGPSTSGLQDDNLEAMDNDDLSRETVEKDFKDIENLEVFIDRFKDDPNKMKKLLFYLLYMATGNTKERTFKQRGQDTADLLSKILENPDFIKNQSVSFYLNVFKQLTDLMGVSENAMVKSLRMIYVVYTCCPHDITFEDLKTASNDIINKVKTYLQSVVSSIATAEVDKKEVFIQIVTLVAKILYQLWVLNRMRTNGMLNVAELVWYIYGHFHDQGVMESIAPMVEVFKSCIGSTVVETTGNMMHYWMKGQLEAAKVHTVYQSVRRDPPKKDCCLVVNNYSYDNVDPVTVTKNQEIIRDIRSYFEKKMEVEVIENCNMDPLKVHLANLNTRLLSSHGRFVMIVISHGDKDRMAMMDGSFFYKADFISTLSDEVRRVMPNKPIITILHLDNSAAKNYGDGEPRHQSNLYNVFLINSAASSDINKQSYLDLLILGLKKSAGQESLRKVCLKAQGALRALDKGMKSKGRHWHSNASFENHFCEDIIL